MFMPTIGMDSNGLAIVSGIPVSTMLELSYVRSASVHRRPSQTLYPTALDYPNVQGKDKLLWFYPFLPTLLSQESFAACAERAERLHCLELATNGAVRDSEYSPALRQQIEALHPTGRHFGNDRGVGIRQGSTTAADRGVGIRQGGTPATDRGIVL